MLSANFKPKRTAAASRGFLARARLSCLLYFYARSNYELDRMNRFRNMAIRNYTRQLMAAILALVQPKVEIFDPPNRKPYHRTKHEVVQMTRCRDMAIPNFPKCEVGWSVGRSLVGHRSLISHVLLFATLGT